MAKGKRTANQSRVISREKKMQALEADDQALIDAYLSGDLTPLEQQQWKRLRYDEVFAEQLAGQTPAKSESFTPSVVSSGEAHSA